MFDDSVMIYDPKDNSIRYSKTREFDYSVLTEFFQSLVCPLSQSESKVQKEWRHCDNCNYISDDFARVQFYEF